MNNQEVFNSPDIGEDVTSLKYMLKLSSPMIVSNMSFTIMQFVNRLMVSKLGTESLAAVLPAAIVSYLPASFIVGLMTSVNTYVSQSFGMGDKKSCSSYCWQVIYLGLAYFTVVSVCAWPNAEWIFKTMGYDPKVVELEVIYFRIMLYTQLVGMLIASTGQFFMGIHRPSVIMQATVAGQVVNVIGNYVLIFGKFGFPQMGIRGAALGTFFGVLVSASIMTIRFLTGDINSTFKSRSSLKIDISKIKGLVKVGLPAGIGLMINISLWGTILFMSHERVREGCFCAATSAVFSCVNVSIMPVLGIGQALTAAVGKAIGEGRKEVAIKQTKISLKICLAYTAIVGSIFIIFDKGLLGFWSSDIKVIEAGSIILIWAATFQLFDATVIIYNGALRGAGDTTWIAVVSAIGVIFILGLGGFCIVKFAPQIGPSGPWAAAMLNIAAKAIANHWRHRSNRWMKIDLFKEKELRESL